MWTELSIYLLLVVSAAWAQRNPEISYITSEAVAEIGGTAELKCSVQFAGTFPVMWFKKANPLVKNSTDVLVSTDALLVARESRFALRHDPESDTYTLQISDIQESDQATYECRCQINLQTSVSGTARLSVRLPPVISDNSTRSAVATEGERVELECYANGVPTPEISWRRDNNALLPTGSSVYRGNKLVIHNIKKDDRGVYYCVASNGVSEPSKRNVAVDVEFPPVITVARPKLFQALQYDMDLQCLVEAFPSPQLTWLKDGLVLNNNQHYKITSFVTTDQTTESGLRAITIERRQYGTYTCRASNRLGVAEDTIQLIEAYSAVCPPECNAGAISNLRVCDSLLVATILATVAVALLSRW